MSLDTVVRPVSRYAFLAGAALLFAASTAATMSCCASMQAMDAMPMPGGWSMSMVWMRMPGQSWPAAAADFLGMWIAMMVAMMLPALVPMLVRYRRSLCAPCAVDGLTVLVGIGYYVVWAAFGLVVFVAGSALASVAMQQAELARRAPLAAGVVLLLVGALQFGAWKARRLACCRGELGACNRLPADVRTAWRTGLRLGMHCCHCCAGLTLLLVVVGLMDLRAMAAVTAAITVERFAPQGRLAARIVGAMVVGAGLVVTVRAVWTCTI